MRNLDVQMLTVYHSAEPIKAFTGKYRWLSNFYPSQVHYQDTEFPTVEHAYQYAKCIDDDDKAKIIAARTAAEAKRIGGSVSTRIDWEMVKEDIMLSLVRQKFSINVLRDMLLETGNASIVEGNTWHDNIWGDCVCRRCAHIHGRNLLGKIIKKVRSELR